MTPPTEKPFEPTREQVEEAGRMLSGLGKVVWNAFPDSKEPWLYAGRRHLAELSTLRSQVEAVKLENAGLHLEFLRMARQIAGLAGDKYSVEQERDALKAQVVVKDGALKHISKMAKESCHSLCALAYIPRRMHAPDCPCEYYEVADQALTQLEAK